MRPQFGQSVKASCVLHTSSGTRPWMDSLGNSRSAELHTRMSALLDRAQRDYPDQPAGPDDAWWLPAHLGGGAPTPEDVAAQE